jgi:hypothetical protein
VGWAIALGLLAAIVGGVYASVRDRNLATIEIAGDELVMTPRGFNKVWALKGRLAVPKSCVKQVRVMANPKELSWGWRLPGTEIPGLIRAGSYIRKGEWSFQLWRGRKPIVLIELEGTRYSRMAVETQNPNEVITELDRILSSS